MKSILLAGPEKFGKRTTKQEAIRWLWAREQGAKAAWGSFLAGEQVMVGLGAFDGKMFLDRGDERGIWWQK